MKQLPNIIGGQSPQLAHAAIYNRFDLILMEVIEKSLAHKRNDDRQTGYLQSYSGDPISRRAIYGLARVNARYEWFRVLQLTRFHKFNQIVAVFDNLQVACKKKVARNQALASERWK